MNDSQKHLHTKVAAIQHKIKIALGHTPHDARGQVHDLEPHTIVHDLAPHTHASIWAEIEAEIAALLAYLESGGHADADASKNVPVTLEEMQKQARKPMGHADSAFGIVR